MEKQNPLWLPLISVSNDALLDQCFQGGKIKRLFTSVTEHFLSHKITSSYLAAAMETKTQATLVLILATTFGIFLLNGLENSAAALTDAQFFHSFALILLGVLVAWIASGIAVFLGDGLMETAVKACTLISIVSLASVVLALAIFGSNLVPNFISQPGHLNFGCRSVPSSYVSMHCGEELWCHTSDCHMLPTMSRLNSSIVCV